MKGLSIKAVEAIEKTIKNKFDTLSLRFLGLIPKKNKEKNVIFSTSRESVLSLFIKALGNPNPNKLEESTLKKMMKIASGYVDGLRDRTTSRVVHDLDSYVRNQQMKDLPVSSKQLNVIVDKEMSKAKHYFKMVANSESNKAVNMGTALQISKIAEQKKEKDPTVFFIVTIDDVTGSEEFALHLLSDRKTPRLWKLSEIGSEYHKKGDPNPKFPGLHPNCRCKITYLAKGWGFDPAGKVKYISPDHDEFKAQREKYGLPR